MSEPPLSKSRKTAEEASAAAHAAARNLEDTGADIDEAVDADVEVANEADSLAGQQPNRRDDRGDLTGTGAPVP